MYEDEDDESDDLDSSDLNGVSSSNTRDVTMGVAKGASSSNKSSSNNLQESDDEF